MLLNSAARSAVAWKRGAAAAARTYYACCCRDDPLRLRCSSELVVCACEGPRRAAAKHACVRATRPERPFATIDSRKRPVSFRDGFSGILHLSLYEPATSLR